MADLRIWQLPFTPEYPLCIAADARLGDTDSRNDAVWEVRPGQGESAAFALQTRYGGRAGLVSLVPMWYVDDRLIYQQSQFASATTIRGFAPGFAQLQTKLTPQIALIAEFWAMESHAVGGRFLLRSLGKQPQTLRLDMLGFVGMDGREMPTKVIFIPGERHALSLGVIRDLTPVLMLDNGFAAAESGGNKLSASLSLAPGARAAVRFVCAAETDARASLSLAKRWLMQNWGPHFKRFSVAAGAIPRIETGDVAFDARTALSYSRLMQTFTQSVDPASAPVMISDRSASKRTRPQPEAHVIYANALAAAAVEPKLAQGVVRGALAAQQEDGWVDAQPRVGDRPAPLHIPLLARLAWSIFQYTEDTDFLREVYPGLRRLFERWLAEDLDVDGDGAPEWQSTTQMGMMTRLALASVRVNAQMVETPGLMAHLLSEALSLREVAHYLRDAAAEAELVAHVERLRGILDSFWDAGRGRYAYRDRDTHRVSTMQTLLSDGEGDADHLLVVTLTPPDRVIVMVEGGFERTPAFSLIVQGVGEDGGEIIEQAETAAFEWETGRGFYTTQAVFARLDRVRCDGLVRVYRVSAFTPDLTMEDADSLLPIWSAAIPRERAAQISQRIQSVFLTEQGIAAEPVTPERAPRVFSALNTLLCEGLLEYGDEQVTEVIRRQFARLDTSQSAEVVPPLHMLLRVLGVRVISRTKAWSGGPFLWGAPLRVVHKGVSVERSVEGTRITFPSKHVVELPPDAPWQEVVDLPVERKRLRKSSGGT